MRAAAGCALLAAGAAAGPEGRPTKEHPFTFQPVHHRHVPHPRYATLQTSTYLSPPMRLMTGEAWFSLPDVTVMPMPAPGVPYAITAVKYDIVDETGRSIPLSEMYSHHWLVYDKLVGGNGYDLGCGGHDNFISNVYGAGGEMRGIDYAYPDGYGYVSQSGKQHWSANIHFIRTQDLDTSYFNGSHGEALKSCIECNHVKGFMKGPECLPGLSGCGTLACCFDGTRCPVNNRQDRTLKQYHLQYNVTWTTEIEKITAINVYVLDGFQCGICQTVGANLHPQATTCDDKTCVSVVEQKMVESGTILWAYTHQHLGALNSSLEINGKYQCTSRPRHGTDPANTPGNEKGYLVGFEMCIDTPQRGMSEAVHINKGDTMRLTSYYSVDPTDTASLPIPGGVHVGTMNLHYFYIAPDTPAPVPPPPAPAQAYTCEGGKCIEAASGVPLNTCQAACGP